MEWPENYAYANTLRLKEGTRKLGHTVTPKYNAYTIRSSDVLSSDHLFGMQQTANARTKKVGTAKKTFAGTTPFAGHTGVTVAALPGFKSLSKREQKKSAFALPPISRRDTEGYDSCNGRTNRLLSVLTNTTPVFVNN